MISDVQYLKHFDLIRSIQKQFLSSPEKIVKDMAFINASKGGRPGVIVMCNGDAL